MEKFFAELKRRHIYRVAAAYAVVAWVLVQLVNNLAPIFELPSWIARAVVLLLIVGFPVTALIAWMSHLAPADGATARATASKLDWALMGALIVVIALVSYQQLAPATGVKTAQLQASIAPGPGGISVAVLPFANLSGDAAQEFFSDGMTEEIMTALAKVSALRVVGRESAFQFKGQKTDMHAVGQALGASYLVEGSVRKAGDQVRITAQLVQADNGVSVWTDSYDRQMKNIFTTQSDIAQAIAGALRVPLGLKQGDTLVANRTSDLDSYQKYLQAKALVRARGLKPLTDTAALLEQVVARDPNYAPAWASLALAYDFTPGFAPEQADGTAEQLRRIVEASFPKAEAAAQRAIQLDPNLADGYFALGFEQAARGKLLSAEELYSKALALDPSNAEALNVYGILLAGVGRLKEAVAMKQRTLVLEPFVPIYNAGAASTLWLNGQSDAAIAMLKDLPRDDPFRAFFLPPIYAAAGRYSEAADALAQMPSGIFRPGTVEQAVRLLRTAPAPAASPQTLPALVSLDYVYLYVGAPGRALDVHERNVEAGYLSTAGAVFWPSSYAPVRKMERFKAIARAYGLVEYWRARGWPEFCHPTTGDDFVCN